MSLAVDRKWLKEIRSSCISKPDVTLPNQRQYKFFPFLDVYIYTLKMKIHYLQS